MDRKSFVGQSSTARSASSASADRHARHRAGQGVRDAAAAYDLFLDAAAAARRRADASLDDMLPLATPSPSTRRSLPRPATSSTPRASRSPRSAGDQRGRGARHDETALLAALESAGRRRRARRVREDTKNWDLIRHPRVVATPHIGAQTREAQSASRRRFEMVLAALDGCPGRARSTCRSVPLADGASVRCSPSCSGALPVAAPRSLRALQIDLWGIDDDMAADHGGGVKARRCRYARTSTSGTRRSPPDRGIEVVRKVHPRHGDYPYLTADAQRRRPRPRGRRHVAGRTSRAWSTSTASG